MSPLQIIILLECHVCAAPGSNIPHQIWTSVAADEVREHFYEAGILRTDTNAVTLAGQQLVERLMSVPMFETTRP